MVAGGLPDAPITTPSETGLRETAYAAVIAAVVVALVYFGRPLLVPLALSILMAFALAPVVEFLRRLRIGRIAGVILTVTMAVLLITGIAGFIGTQLAWLAVSLPQYHHNVIDKIQSVEGSAANSPLVQSAIRMIDNLSKQIALVPLPAPGKTPDLQSKATEAQNSKPAVPVVIQEPPPGPLQ